jgi:hypothetical protein
VLERDGRSFEGVREETDSLLDEQPVLASCYAAAAGDVQLLGAAPGQKTAKLVCPVRFVFSTSEALAEVGGVNVHAKVMVDGRDRRTTASSLPTCSRARRSSWAATVRARPRSACSSRPPTLPRSLRPSRRRATRGRGCCAAPAPASAAPATRPPDSPPVATRVSRRHRLAGS